MKHNSCNNEISVLFVSRPCTIRVSKPNSSRPNPTSLYWSPQQAIEIVPPTFPALQFSLKFLTEHHESQLLAAFV
jgi:hypothetical protein